MSNVIHLGNTTRVESVLGSTKLGKPVWGIYYGIEMEYDVITPKEAFLKGKEATNRVRNDEATPIFKVVKDFAIIKHDGSMKNGFEVVSVPMTLDAHRNSWGPFFTIIKKASVETHNLCGMHVHVSKSLLTPFQIGKMLVFIYSKSNSQFIRSIAGRNPPPSYAELGEKKIGDCNKHHIRKSALNLTGNNTIEFRLFKSTYL